MAKRFTDTNKWDDDWFLELALEYKLAWQYICDNCDNVGVWKTSRKAISFHVGVEIDLVEFLRICGPKRIKVMDGKWWIRGFCDFNYNDSIRNHHANPPAKKSPAVESYVKLLKNHGLWDEYIDLPKGIAMTIDSHKDKDKDKDQDKDQDRGVQGGKQFEFANIDEMFLRGFDELTMENYTMHFKGIDVKAEPPHASARPPSAIQERDLMKSYLTTL